MRSLLGNKKLILGLVFSHLLIFSAVVGYFLFIREPQLLEKANGTIAELNIIEENRVNHINGLSDYANETQTALNSCYTSYSNFIINPSNVAQVEEFVKNKETFLTRQKEIMQSVDNTINEYNTKKQEFRYIKLSFIK